jgi:hypothetical protein
MRRSDAACRTRIATAGGRENRKRWPRREMAASARRGEEGRRHATVGAAPAELSHGRVEPGGAQWRVRRGVGCGIYGRPCDECGAIHFFGKEGTGMSLLQFRADRNDLPHHHCKDRKRWEGQECPCGSLDRQECLPHHGQCPIGATSPRRDIRGHFGTWAAGRRGAGRSAGWDRRPAGRAFRGGPGRSRP